jgi:hypothetical protein
MIFFGFISYNRVSLTHLSFMPVYNETVYTYQERGGMPISDFPEATPRRFCVSAQDRKWKKIC